MRVGGLFAGGGKLANVGRGVGEGAEVAHGGQELAPPAHQLLEFVFFVY